MLKDDECARCRDNWLVARVKKRARRFPWPRPARTEYHCFGCHYKWKIENND